MNHKLIIILIFLINIISFNSYSESINSPVSFYKIKAELNPQKHLVEASEIVKWINISKEPVKELKFHLYLNAFQPDSTFIKEGRASENKRVLNSDLINDTQGGIEIESIKFVDINGIEGGNQISKLSFIHPDDNNDNDKTVAVLKLDKAIQPGQSITLSLNFRSSLPEIISRTGYKNDFFFVAQWFPKFCMFDEQFNCHQFHVNSEFFSNFTLYDVEITVPQNYIVAGCGDLIAEETKNNKKIYHYKTNYVHDFSWVASPNLLKIETDFDINKIRDMEYEKNLSQILGVSADSLRLPKTRILLFIPSEHKHQSQRYIDAITNGLYWFGLWFGPYPYKTITLVSPPEYADYSGGMEYPTLISLGTTIMEAQFQYETEWVTIHEFGHQYFYGLVASNEFEEPWLDEGITSYITGKIFHCTQSENPGRCFQKCDIKSGRSFCEEFSGWTDYYRYANFNIPYSPYFENQDAISNIYSSFGINNGSIIEFLKDFPPVNFQHFRYESMWSRISFYRQYAEKDYLAKSSWDFIDSLGAYRAFPYGKGAILLWTLERRVGENKMLKIMRDYVDKNKFKHPVTADFIQSVWEIAGEKEANFVRAALYSSEDINYKVEKVYCESIKNQNYQCTVQILRTGGFPVDVETLIVFENGRKVKKIWEPCANQDLSECNTCNNRWIRWNFTSPDKIKEVIIDPQYKLPLESDRSDNYFRMEGAISPSLRFMTDLLVWTQQILIFMSGII